MLPPWSCMCKKYDASTPAVMPSSQWPVSPETQMLPRILRSLTNTYDYLLSFTFTICAHIQHSWRHFMVAESNPYIFMFHSCLYMLTVSVHSSTCTFCFNSYLIERKDFFNRKLFKDERTFMGNKYIWLFVKWGWLVKNN